MPTGIQWTWVPGYTGETWNPTVGCTRVSPGCDHCYAFQLHDQRHVAWKLGRFDTAPAQYYVPFSTVQLLKARLTEPLRATKPRAYFVDSMADLFHEDVPDDYVDRVFAVMALSSRHIFMVLTKRPERMRAYMRAMLNGERDMTEAARVWRPGDAPRDYMARLRAIDSAMRWSHDVVTDEVGFQFHPGKPLPNVWLGVSAEDQQRADERIPLLLDTPAAVRFVSAEPLLGPIDFTHMDVERVGLDMYWINALTGRNTDMGRPNPDVPALDWVIVGGESGPHARPFDLAWARSIRDQCAAAGVAFFMKQLGEGTLITPRDDFPVARRGHNGDPALWPEDLRVREWPRGAAV